MQNLVINKKMVEFSKVTGAILSSDKYSETHVYSRGGGPLPGGGSSAASVHSDVTTKQEFWIKTDDGSETSIQLSGVDIPLRIGQRISVISAQRTDKKLSTNVALVNHTARSHWVLHDGHTFSTRLDLVSITGFSILGSILVWVLSKGVFTAIGQNSLDSTVLAVFVAVAYLLYRMIKWYRKFGSYGGQFITHLNAIAKAMY